MSPANKIPASGAEAPRPTPESPSKDYQDENETHDSRLKAVWDSEMGAREENYSVYEKASVLLLSWHKDDDDLATAEEVTNLEQVFRDEFNYKTTKAELRKNIRASAQIQAHVHLANFLFEHDDESTLLVIYYAGHGKPGKDRGTLALTGSRSTSLPSTHNNVNEVVWNSAEEIIKQTKADVLVIFDCCYAGDLELAVRAHLPSRAFEYLAATSSNSTTKGPGPHSFTSALIHSLSSLVKDGGSFSTQQLVSGILEAPGFPKDQGPRLHERLHSRRKIFLSALTPKSVNRAIEAKAAPEKPREEPSQDLLLRFGFNNINDKTIREMAQFLRGAITSKEIKAKTISWEGIDMPVASQLSFQEIVNAQPGLRYFRNKLRQIRNGIDTAEKVLQPKVPKVIGVEGPISPGSSLDGCFNATPDRRLSAEPESGIRQGSPAYINSPLSQIVQSPSAGGGQQTTDTPSLATRKGSKRSHDEDAEVPLLTTPNKRSRSDK
ncbi:hypothetical protein G7054_g8499 [Neopestalotiopsis clavispora]|nr:hypothetical protein G7054_g8499 [Neopestalotiopsis clavispora]